MKSTSSNADDVKRERSTIQFPYGDLDNAIEVVKAVYSVGGSSCTLDQVAAALGQAAKGGAFQLRMTYPRIFGLANVEKGEISLTELGQKIVDPTQEASARVDAFLNVPLYKAIFEKYKGYTLPPPVALEREMLNLGVSSKQTDKARQAFDRSAKQAGFYSFGADRLVIPSLKGNKPEGKPLEDKPPTSIGADNGGGGNIGGYHPFIEGLLKTLPAPDSNWSAEDRKKWLTTAENIFGLIYKDE